MDKNCVFCKVINDELPSYKIFEDEQTVAFLDINPINPGHLLVIPKIHAERLSKLDEQSALALFKTVKKIEETVSEMPECNGTNLIQNNGKSAGQLINHVHFHVVPRTKGDSFRFKYDKVDESKKQLADYAGWFRKRLL
jgi:histidine triad (HIT) family protein